MRPIEDLLRYGSNPCIPRPSVGCSWNKVKLGVPTWRHFCHGDQPSQATGANERTTYYVAQSPGHVESSIPAVRSSLRERCCRSPAPYVSAPGESRLRSTSFIPPCEVIENATPYGYLSHGTGFEFGRKTAELKLGAWSSP